jgi:hypothetical protein
MIFVVDGLFDAIGLSVPHATDPQLRRGDTSIVPTHETTIVHSVSIQEPEGVEEASKAWQT